MPKMEVIYEEGLNYPQGITCVKIKDKKMYLILLWCGKKIEIYETLAVDLIEGSTLDGKVTKNEIDISCDVIDIFHLDQGLIYVLDADGVVHSFQMITDNAESPVQFMEVDDLFNSPTSAETSKWKENTIIQIENCDSVIGCCHSTFGFAALGLKDKRLAVYGYSFPEFRFKFFLDIHEYNSQNAVLSSCQLADLSPSLKCYFQDNLEVLDNEIIVVGLSSGLILWFSTNNPKKGPFALFSAHHEVEKIHWLEDTRNSLLSYLLIVLSSGSVIIFGKEKISTKFLPDSIKASCCISNQLITSNTVDCYINELRTAENIDMNSVLLPLKGVSAMTKSCDSETLLAATVHGTLYCFNIKATPPETSVGFTIPEEHILDNLLAQAKNLDSIYKQLAIEDSILKAVSTAMAVNNSHLFGLTLKVVSDVEFCLISTLKKTGVVFSHKHCLANVEVTGKHGYKQTSQNEFTKDFSSDSELQVNMKHSLSIGDIVSLELMLSFHTKQPIIIVPIDKVKIDAGHLIVTQVLAPRINSKEESLEDILYNLSSESLSKRRLQECKLSLKIPDNLSINSVLPTILSDCQERIAKDEWDKLKGGKKHSIQVNVYSQSALIHLEVESRVLTITSCDIQLCYQVKEAVLKRLKTLENKHIVENVALEVQGLNQEFEIKSFTEEQDFNSLDIIRKRLRSTLSCHFVL